MRARTRGAAVLAWAAAVGAPGVAFAAPSDATESRPPSGAYVRFTLGSGYLSTFGRGPQGSASIAGLGFYGGVAVGGAIAPGLVVAGVAWGAVTTSDFAGGPLSGAVVVEPAQNGASTKASTTAVASLVALGAIADWYPAPDEGWHLGGGLGIGLIGVTTTADGRPSAGSAPSGLIFGGYDWRIGRGWSLGLALVAAGATPSSLEDTRAQPTGYRLAPLTAGIETSLLDF